MSRPVDAVAALPYGTRVPGPSFFLLFDDIAAVLDDVATMAKAATKKTAGVLGDDLALNAEQVSGVRAERELPVVWAVAKGSARNKVILVPIALALSALAPWAVTPLLVLGGAFLCFEGAEKLLHGLLHPGDRRREGHVRANADAAVDLVAREADKIAGAVRTDFILSAEIIVISLGVMTQATFGARVAALCAVAAVMTVGVYGLVAAIVKLDDVGLALSRRGGPAATLGRALLWGAPKLMKLLSVAGTTAMFLVGGGILSHGVPPLHHLVEALAARAGAAGGLVSAGAEGLTGLAAGALLALVVTGVRRRLSRSAGA